jgi:hypothetical protein
MIRSLATVLVVASVALPPPGEVVIDEVEGLSVLDEQLVLDFEGYRTWAPQLVDHLDPVGEAAAGMQGAYRIWGGDGIDGVIVNLTLWPTADDAARYVDQAARDAASLGLAAEGSPFEGVLRFDGTDADGASLTYLTWRDEQYGVAMVAVGADLGDIIVEAARDQQALLDVATGGEVTSTDTPPPDEGARNRMIGIFAFFGLVAFAVALFWLSMKMRRRGASDERSSDERSAAERTDRSVDEIIAGARLDRGDRMPAQGSTDDIVAEARRQAREDVEAASAEWQTPDDA